MTTAANRKKSQQLGMDAGTASHRLLKDILFEMVIEKGEIACFRCGEKMTRQNFSVEHKKAWLDSGNPVKLFFDLDNISFSHRSCNTASARKPAGIVSTTHGQDRMFRHHGCRCDLCKMANTLRKRKAKRRHRANTKARNGNLSMETLVGEWLANGASAQLAESVDAPVSKTEL